MLDFYICNGYTKSTEIVKRYTNPDELFLDSRKGECLL